MTRQEYLNLSPEKRREYIQAAQKTVYYTSRQAGLSDMTAKLITAQATHESGNFGSPLYLRANNAFGMTVPTRRPKTYIAGYDVKQPDGTQYYAKYDSLKNSVLDLVKGYHSWVKTDWSGIHTPEQYATYLKVKGYYGDTVANYLRNLRSHLEKLSWLKYVAFPFGLLFFFQQQSIF